MAMATPCGGCEKTTSWICAAQYCNGKHHVIICSACYEQGERCWVLPDGSLKVSKEKPEGGRAAALYWDEGGFVTGGEEEVTYPNRTQPEG